MSEARRANKTERAIAEFEEYKNMGYGQAYRPSSEAIETALTALRAQENEPLTVVPFVITMANGEPVDYGALGKRYSKELLEFDLDGIYVNEDGEMVLMDDCGHCVWLNRDEFAITREPAPDGGKE